MGNDKVNHPDHYNAHPSGVECIDIVEHMPFNTGSAIKYLWRAGLKGDHIEDLKKARWYIDREIQRLEKTERMNKRENTSCSGNATHDDGSFRNPCTLPGGHPGKCI